jgi:Spy/CpxP family protein refolding chaperone
MKRTLLGLSLLTVLAAALAFPVARWMTQRHGHAAGSLHDSEWLGQMLGLTRAQAAELKTIEGGFRDTIESTCASHCRARFELAEELAKPQVDRAHAAACVDRMCAAQAESERATLEHILKVRAVLTPEQQQRYARLINEQMCSACPLGMHTP